MQNSINDVNQIAQKHGSFKAKSGRAGNGSPNGRAE